MILICCKKYPAWPGLLVQVLCCVLGGTGACSHAFNICSTSVPHFCKFIYAFKIQIKIIALLLCGGPIELFLEKA